MKQKIIKVLHIITSFECGGAQTSLKRLIKFSDKEIKNKVIVLKGKNIFYDFLPLNESDILFLDINSIPKLLKGILDTIKFIFKNKIEIIHSWLPHSDIFACLIKIFLPKIKLIWSIRYSELNKKNTKKLTLIIIKFLKYLSYIFPSIIIFCSNKSLQYHKKKGFCPEKLFLIYNSVDPDLFKNDINILSKTNNNKLFTFGTLSRFHPIKDHLTLLKSFSVLPKDIKSKVQLFLAGDGLEEINIELKNMLRKYIPDIKVVLFGEIKNIKAYLSDLDIFTLSSVSESFPNVLAESMAVGTPCISTDVGDASKIIGAEGWIVPVKNFNQYSDAIIASFNLNKKRRKELSLNAKRRIKLYFSNEKYVKSHFNIYRSLI